MNSAEEAERFSKKKKHFKGSAKIDLEHLQFAKFDASEFLNPKNVARLKRIFELEGCLRLDPEHHIPVIIDLDILERSLAQSRIRRGDLFDSRIPPELTLPPDCVVICLHGRHRIAAARECLLADDRWWTVDIYSESRYFPSGLKGGQN